MKDIKKKTESCGVKRGAFCRAVSLLLCVLLCALLFSCGEKEHREDLTKDTEPVEATLGGGEPFTVLLGGTDRAGGLCDVLMLLTLSADRECAYVIQLPRDTYALYAEGRYRKLNGGHKFLGSMDALRQYLSESLGVEIQRSICLSPDALCEVVDTLGGVEINVPQDMDYVDPSAGLSIHLKKGKQRLNGKDAEKFLRYRSGYLRGDLGRMDAQKLFMAAMLKRLREVGASELCGLLTVRGMETDLKTTDCLRLFPTVRALPEDRIFFVTAPGAEARSADGGSYYSLSAEGMEQLLRTVFGDRAGRFDPKGVFLNGDNPKFSAIYRGTTEPRFFTAAELSQEEK